MRGGGREVEVGRKGNRREILTIRVDGIRDIQKGVLTTIVMIGREKEIMDRIRFTITDSKKPNNLDTKNKQVMISQFKTEILDNPLMTMIPELIDIITVTNLIIDTKTKVDFLQEEVNQQKIRKECFTLLKLNPMIPLKLDLRMAKESLVMIVHLKDVKKLIVS